MYEIGPTELVLTFDAAPKVKTKFLMSMYKGPPQAKLTGGPKGYVTLLLPMPVLSLAFARKSTKK